MWNLSRIGVAGLLMMTLLALSPLTLRLLRPAYANSTAQTVPFTQDWSNSGLITANDDWTGVPGIVGFRGDGLASGTAANPQLVVGEGVPVIDVNANQTNPNTFTTGGVAEFAIANPTIALQGSGTANAPYVQFHLNTTGATSINVAYNLRDIDGSADNAVQPVALQYRIGNSGNFTNLPAGFVADATTGPSLATLVTPISVTLPAACENQPLVEVRVITTDAVGSDEWVGVDDINITGNASTNPSGVGTANPGSVAPTQTSLLTVAVTPGTNPTSTAHTVSANLSLIGGNTSQAFHDDGLNGDVSAGDNIFSFNATVANGTSGGAKSLPFTITETAPQSRTGSGTIALTVLAATNPSGTGAATPSTVEAGGNSLLTVTVTPGTNPTSTGLTVTGDLTAIGGSASQQFFDDGSNGDVTPGNNVFSYNATIDGATTLGPKVLPVQIADAQARSASTSIALTVQASSAQAGSVVISQIYGGGGNTGSTLKNDYIELINHSSSPVNLSGWSVQAWVSSTSTWEMTPLTNFTLQPGQYYLIQESQGAGGTTNLPTPDAVGTIAVSSTSTKVLLVNNTTLVTGICPNAGAAGIVDLIGYGATDCFEGTAPAPTLSNTTAALRRNEGCFDTNQNANDVITGSPNPRNSSTPVHDCTSLSAYGTANPSSVLQGGSTTLTVYVAAGQNPNSSGVTVNADLSQIGGSPTQSFSGSGSVFTFGATVPVANSTGMKSLPVTVTDAQARTANTNILVSVLPLNADHITISQVYGGGGNASATYTNDYVELYNPTPSTVTITGWSLQYASAAGTSWTNKQPLGGIIGPGEYYLVQLASGGSNGAPLPVSPNISGDINISATTGKIALVNNSTTLTGDCPLGSTHIVDFVGYGTGATCHEGTANAPAPGNSTAILRKNSGSLDSDQNGTDFQTGAPNPRRTATIVELGPWVSGTDPGTGDNTIPYDATITVNFSEPVTVDPGWYNINCSVSGAHNSATEAHFSDLKTYAVTPNVSFQFGEQCTVTIPKTSVHDVDADDSGADTDTLFEDYTWSFTVVAAGQAAPYPPSVHLTMGDPGCGTPFGCAAASTSQPDNYLMEKPTYSLSYNRDKATPNWVSWHLDTTWYGTLARVDTFRPDPKVDPSWYRVQAFDYSGSGFDRGHMTPNADRDNQNRVPINQETYLMSNMIPQAPGNNQGPWAALEGDLRTISDGGNELYIVSGPLGVGGSGSNGGTTNTIANGNITVPAFTWKVALVLPKADGDDTARVTCSTRTIAVLMPNLDNIRPNSWQTYLTTVDNVEQQTGFDFFSNLPPAIQACIEAGTNGTNPPGTSGGSVSTAEDNSVNVTLNAASPGGPLTYTIVTPPAHGQLTGSGANRTYAPNLNFNGTDSFTFKVNDGSQDSNTSTVTITVTEVNDSPTAVNDSASTNQDTPVNIAATDLTTNDSAGPANEASQTLTVTSVSSTGNTHGAVALNSGTVTYTPTAGYNGPASFTYQVCDNGTTNGAPDSLCTTGTVNVEVDATSPVLAANGATISQEGLTPANNAVDPSERVSMNLKLINNGNGATSNLVGTLQASANVIAPSGPISFGSIAASGGTAGRDFSFTAVGNCGDLITLALQLQDGGTDFGTVFYSVRLGVDSGGGNYVCTTPSGTPNVVVTTTLTRQNATTVVANISIQNIGPVTANNVVMNNAKLGTTNGTPLPQAAGNLLPGVTFNTTVNFTNSTPGASSTLVVGGTYTGGTFSTTKRVTIP